MKMIEDNKQGTPASSGSGHTPLSEPTPHDCGTITYTSCLPSSGPEHLSESFPPYHGDLLMQLVTKGGIP